MAYLLADPQSKLNLSHDWSEFLAVGETIASRQWTISPSSGSPSATLTGDTTDTVFVEGLETGKVYHLTERITTSAGVIDDRTITIRCDPS